MDYVSELTMFCELEHGWDGDNADPPSQVSITSAFLFLEISKSSNLNPSTVMPSVNGGVGLTFCNNENSVYVEFTNLGKCSVVFMGKVSPTVINFESNSKAFCDTILDISKHLGINL